MNTSGQLLWFATPFDFGKRTQVRFSFGPGTGLTDADFHPVTDRNWPAMTSPAPDAIAVVEVPSSATMAQVDAAIQTIAAKGRYRFIEVERRD